MTPVFSRPRLGRCFIIIFLLAAVSLGLGGCGKVLPKAGEPDYRPFTETGPPKPSGKSYKIKGVRYQTLATAAGYVEKGLATWYGPGFQGKKTASGERFNTNRYTAAHKTLPFGTVVEVRNVKNGEKVLVRINDRGPFVKGRIIDLSRTAARRIGISGVGEVEVKAVGTADK